jgi:hypothetical protein
MTGDIRANREAHAEETLLLFTIIAAQRSSDGG